MTKRKLPDEFADQTNQGEESEQTLLQALTRTIDNENIADVRFLVGPDAVPVHACKWLLTLRSPVFRAMLKGFFKEALPLPPASSSSSSSTSSSSDASPIMMTEVKLPEMQVRTFRRLLYLIHTDQLPNMNETEAESKEEGGKSQKAPLKKEQVCFELVDLYLAADHFLIPRAKSIVRASFAQCLNIPYVLPVLNHCTVVAPELVSALMPFVRTSASALLGNFGSQWLALSKEAVSHVLKADIVELKEVELFQAVHRWYLQRLKEANEMEEEAEEGQHPKERLLESVQQVLEGINTELMSGVELAEKVEPMQLLSSVRMQQAFRFAATHYRFVLVYPQLKKGSLDLPRTQHNDVLWHVILKQADRNAKTFFISFCVDRVGPRRISTSLCGVNIMAYCNRTLVVNATIRKDDRVRQGEIDSISFAYNEELEECRITILVHIPCDLFD